MFHLLFLLFANRMNWTKLIKRAVPSDSSNSGISVSSSTYTAVSDFIFDGRAEKWWAIISYPLFARDRASFSCKGDAINFRSIARIFEKRLEAKYVSDIE